jgi:hypothetical protein
VGNAAISTKPKAKPRGKPFGKGADNPQKPGTTNNPSGLSPEQRKRQDDIATYVRDKLAEVREDGRSNMCAAVDASIEAAVLPDGLSDREFLFAYAFGRPVQHIAGKIDSDISITIKRTVRKDAPPADANV